MKQINLSMALKIKSRLIGEINKLKLELGRGQTKQFMMHEDRFVGITAKEIADWKTSYVSKLEKYDELMKNLITLKVKIQTANAASNGLLVSLEEMKNNLQFINQLRSTLSNSFDCDANEYTDEYIGTTGKDNEIAVTRRTMSAVGPNELSIEAKTMQDIVNKLQDDLDSFNASTTIDWED
jgi:hypothetical protein